VRDPRLSVRKYTSDITVNYTGSSPTKPRRKEYDPFQNNLEQFSILFLAIVEKYVEGAGEICDTERQER
jgi:hypothetical protein